MARTIRLSIRANAATRGVERSGRCGRSAPRRRRGGGRRRALGRRRGRGGRRADRRALRARRAADGLIAGLPDAIGVSVPTGVRTPPRPAMMPLSRIRAKTTATAITNHFEMLSRSWTASSDGVAARFAGVAVALGRRRGDGWSGGSRSRILRFGLFGLLGLLGLGVFGLFGLFGLLDVLVLEVARVLPRPPRLRFRTRRSPRRRPRLRRRARSRRAPARRACPAVDRSSGEALLHTARAARRRHGAGASVPKRQPARGQASRRAGTRSPPSPAPIVSSPKKARTTCTGTSSANRPAPPIASVMAPATSA